MEATTPKKDLGDFEKFVSTEALLYAPKKKEESSKEKSAKRRKMMLEDPSSPVKIYNRGWYEGRAVLASCNCYLGPEICYQVPCKCPKKKKFKEEDLIKKKKISLKCTCPVVCREYPSGQEMF